MTYKTVFVYLILFLILTGCSNNMFYVENDNYSAYYNSYINNIKDLNSKENYKLIAVFYDEASFGIAKNRIKLIKQDQFNKVDIYTIIIYPYGKDKAQNIKGVFSYLDNLYAFLKTKKQYKNNWYTVGIPQQSSEYLVLLYFKPISNKG